MKCKKISVERIKRRANFAKFSPEVLDKLLQAAEHTQTQSPEERKVRADRIEDLLAVIEEKFL